MANEHAPRTQSNVNARQLGERRQLMRSPFQRLFDEFMNFPLLSGFPAMSRPSEGMFMPRMNLSESDTELRISMELPGIDENDVDITLTPEGLLVRGEKRDEFEERDGDERYYTERTFGVFERFIPLPDGVDEENVQAMFDRGVLQISIEKPETESRQARRIQVQRSDERGAISQGRRDEQSRGNGRREQVNRGRTARGQGDEART